MKTEEERDLFCKEVGEVCRKHGVHHAAICGNMDDSFISAAMIENDCKGTLHDFVDVATNTGRMWQHSRETVRGFLDNLEKGAWK